MIYLTPSAEKENFMESGIDILGVVFGRLKKNVTRITTVSLFYPH